MDDFEEKKRSEDDSVTENNHLYLEDEADEFDVSELLRQQVHDVYHDEEYHEEEEQQMNISEEEPKKMEYNIPKKKGTPKKMMKYKLLKVFGITAASLFFIGILLIGTKGGRSLILNAASHIILGYMNTEDTGDTLDKLTIEDILSGFLLGKNEEEEEYVAIEKSEIRQEDYVKNYLIFGLEEIYGAKNSDTMMIASINTKDNSIKLTSLMRDTYVEIPGWTNNKLNAAFAKGGVTMLIDTIEHNYKIKLEGYAYVNFSSFEKIIDYLGGVTIELGSTEANYLNTTNYISNPANRNVHAGVNVLNGNQALGYCRVRKVVTLGGFNNDYGRTVRQKRVLSAIFEQCKNKGMFELLGMMEVVLGYVTTNMSASDIQKALVDIVENGITTLDTFRVPVDGMFNDPKEFNGITYPLVLDWDANVKELFKFIFLDTDEEAQAELNELSEGDGSSSTS